MPIICPACGQLSQDQEFCEHCNADLSPSAMLNVPEFCPWLGEDFSLSQRGRESLARPGSVLEVAAADGQHWRIHWLPETDAKRWLPMLEERARFQLKALPNCHRIEETHGSWLAAVSTGRRIQPWREVPDDNPLHELRRLDRYAVALAGVLEEIYENGLVWLNFDPAELEQISAAGEPLQLRITNLDLELFPIGSCPEQVAYKRAFAAPEICRRDLDLIGEGTDVFQLSLFCYYWLARRLPAGFPGAGLESFAFQMPPLRIFMPDLPPGIAEVLRIGLAVNPKHRYGAPNAFLAAWHEALARIEQRWVHAVPVGWDIGAHTRVGRAKSALEGTNDDRVLVKEFPDPPRALVAVADGISVCDVGTGDIASYLTVEVLDRMFSEFCLDEDFSELIVQVGQHAADALLDWALRNGHEQSLRDGLNLMGTTLTAAWLQKRMLSLANLGDSRAYLLTDNLIEQMTVDGDLATGLIAAGAPPEQVRDLGNVGKALRECIGGCEISASGELTPLTGCLPGLTRCPLVPGDVVILCSDGLIDEGVFLEPASVLALVRKHRDLPSAALAVLLAEAADATQRTPSEEEPEGYGDNISCIVVKIAARGQESAVRS